MIAIVMRVVEWVCSRQACVLRGRVEEGRNLLFSTVLPVYWQGTNSFIFMQ